jgi:hydrogenase maturation protease
LCLERLRKSLSPNLEVELLEDYQLQVEHALDLVGRARVLFIDASVGCQPPFEISSLQAGRDASFSTHALSPQSLLQVYTQLQDTAPPTCTMLAIRGERFELGEPLSKRATAHLDQALPWIMAWLHQQRHEFAVSAELNAQ